LPGGAFREWNDFRCHRTSCGWLIILLSLSGGAVLVGAYLLAGVLDRANRAMQ
jgi:hypothetical protein